VALACAAALPASAQEANPLARPGTDDPALLNGTWNGADLEARSNCTSSPNNGNHGTYAQYVIGVGTGSMGITENGITGLTCSYSGDYSTASGAPQWSGTYSCTDGKHGTFQSTGILASRHEMSIQLTIKLDQSETCDITAVIGGSRL
jgi:hypothetical protein